MAFGKEIREFIAAMAAGEKMMSSFGDREYKRLRQQLLHTQIRKANDPETERLDKDLKRASIAAKNRVGVDVGGVKAANAKLLGAKYDYYRQLQENAKNQPKAPSAADSVTPIVPPSEDKGRAVEPDGYDEPVVDEVGAGEGISADDEDTMAFRRGGAVPRKAVPAYDDGGEVEEDLEDTDTDTDLDDDDITSEGNNLGFSPAAAHDAAREGIQYAMRATGADEGERQALDEVSSQRRQGSRSAYLARSGASSHEEMEAVRNAIDPQKRLTDSQRNMAALAHVYKWNLERGDPEGAKRAAASMLQYYGHMADRYSALAKVAAESGNVDATVQNLLKMHANVPDGMDLRVVKTPTGIAYTYQDEATGKVYEKGIASPDQIVQFATKGLVSMESLITQAAGHRAGGGGGARSEKAAPAGRKFSDREDPLTAIEEVAKGRTGADTDMAPAANHFAGQILSDNDISAADAYDIAKELATVGVEPKFKIERTQDGGAVAQIGGREVRLSKDAFGNLAALRGRAELKLKAQDAKDDAEEDAADERRALEVEADEANKARIRKMGGVGGANMAIPVP